MVKRKVLLQVGCICLLMAGIAIFCSGQCSGGSMHRYEVPVTSFSLRVSPEELKQPAGLTVQVFTRVDVLNPEADYSDALREYVETHFRVEAELYAPFPSDEYPVEVACAPGQALQIEGQYVQEPGTYLLKNIRLVSLSNGRTFLYSQPSEVHLEIGGDLFFAYIETHPMSMAEMEEAGIIFGEDAYRGYALNPNYDLVFNICSLFRTRVDRLIHMYIKRLRKLAGFWDKMRGSN